MQPASDAPADVTAAHTFDGIFNWWYIEALTKGTYPADILAGLAPHMPANWQDDMPIMRQPLDWLGVNYYTRGIIQADPGAQWPHFKDAPGTLPTTQMGWEIYPDGLRNILVRMAQEYVGDLPMYVTENGMANADVVADGAVNDQVREDYLFAHLTATKTAISQGANVKGFFYWSLMDNYEWSLGYEKQFGLVHVDFDTLKRTPKASYHALRRAIARND
jgi:beta-glucosidase